MNTQYKVVHAKDVDTKAWDKYKDLVGVPSEVSAMAYHCALHYPRPEKCKCKRICKTCGKEK
jgi:hypothetical protein